MMWAQGWAIFYILIHLDIFPSIDDTRYTRIIKKIVLLYLCNVKRA